MRIKTKIKMLGIVFLLSAGMSISCKCNVFAQEEVNGGAYFPGEEKALSEEEQIKEILLEEDKLSEDQKQDLAAKMRIVNEEENVFSEQDINAFTDSIESRAVVFVKKILKVKHFEQKNDYYCDPATTRQTLKYYWNSFNTVSDSKRFRNDKSWYRWIKYSKIFE